MPHKTIRTQFLLLILLVLVPVTTLSVFLYQTTLRTIWGFLTDNLALTVSDGARSVDTFLEAQRSFLRVLARDPVIASRSDLPKIPSWLQSAEVSNSIKRLNWINSAGTGFTSSGVQYDASDREYFLEAMKGNEWIEGPLFSRVDSSWIFVVSQPIKNGGGEVIGVLAAIFNLDVLSEITRHLSHHKGGEVWMLDASSRLIASSSGRTELTGKTVDSFASSPDDLVATAPLDGVAWKLGASVPFDALISPIRFILVLVGLLLAFAALGIAGYLVLMRRSAERLEAMREERSRALHSAYEQIHKLAYFDDTTKVANRHLLTRKIGELIDTGQQREVLILGLSRFRQLTTTFGIAFGDELLRIASQRMAHAFGPELEPFLARLSGSEFVLILSSGVANSVMLSQHMKKLIALFEDPIGTHDIRIDIRVHVGGLFMPPGLVSPDELLRMAEAALWEARRSGFANGTQISDEVLRRHERKGILQKHLPHALSRKEIYAHYQPQVDVYQSRIVGFEALIRWTHPSLGEISPTEFIPIAEETGMIVKLGQWIMQESLNFALEWSRSGFKPAVVSVNVSPLQILQPEFFDFTESLIAQSQVNPAHFGLEITESALMVSIDQVLPRLRWLREQGIHISLDDFGTGYSSFSYLKHLPFTTLKIDRSFILEIENDERAVQLIRSMIDMSHRLGLRALSEGVETEGQRLILAEQGCDMIQGFHTGRPMPREAFFPRR